jgi:hypothetical protein
MKTLVDLLAAEIQRHYDPDELPPEVVEPLAAGIVGAVQEWLTQPEVVAEAEINGYPGTTMSTRRMLEGLRRQAGEGLES